MNALAILIVLAAWASVFVRLGKVVDLLLFLVFTALGLGFAFFGGLNYWWDSSMQPSKASALPLICGVLILIAELVVFLRRVDADEIVVGPD
jgi:hypothetical protein